ncbi:MAG: 1-(5-phosphoribosyl)-5-[(5-phosphoribosylamino)methylideneamino]imidazole-4-carboxamide isomerase [Pseudomonadota bacterium]|nr:1-(5-phosphoribosyl)-5-[(5-phosphoribosylamino)methylideneamino]imidazole-4-carboxamide isomerase [Pseudomonadota bacterium]
MILFPAIDLKGGKCVRLRRGVMAEATVFNDDPAAQAAAFEAQGFEWLHVVDLDGAFAGRSVNRPAIEAVLNASRLPVQLGGGIRTLGAIEEWLKLGVRRVILGTAAAEDPAVVRAACSAFPGAVAIGIDARGGAVAVAGWARTSGVAAEDLARRYEDVGVAALIYTDIDRDGMLAGLNVAAALKLAHHVAVPVIVGGGLGSIADVRRLLEPDCRRLAGAIAGRALYDGNLDAATALQLVGASRKAASGVEDQAHSLS